MSKFYIIKPAVDTEETGKVYPQAGMTLNYDKNTSNSFTKLKSFEIPDFIPNFDHFVLDKDAKLTDLISGSLVYYGLLISQNFYELLKSFNLQEHAFFDAIIDTPSGIENYYWLHLGTNEIIENINYPASSFFMKINLISKKEIKLNSYQDYWETLKKNNYKVIKHKGLTLDEKIKYDLFVIPFFDGQIYISEILKNSILENGLTGININATSDLTFLDQEL